MGLFSFIQRWWSKPDISAEKVGFVFFGLGNPGEKYTSTRHNIGFRVIDAFVETLVNRRQVPFPEADAVFGKIDGGVTVAAVKPLTFMNRSGFAVQTILCQLNMAHERCLVVVDDFNLPLGTMRLRRNGSDGGHNGLKSIVEQVGPGFSRLRIGIGPLPTETKIIDFVLGNFNESEEKELAGLQKKIINLLTAITVENIETVMNKYN